MLTQCPDCGATFAPGTYVCPGCGLELPGGEIEGHSRPRVRATGEAPGYLPYQTARRPGAQPGEEIRLLPQRDGATSADTKGPAMTAAGHSGIGSWHELAAVLRETTFGRDSSTSLAASTSRLLTEIARPRLGLYPRENHASADHHLRNLRQVIEDASSPATQPWQVSEACTHAELLRGWILDLIADNSQRAHDGD